MLAGYTHNLFVTKSRVTFLTRDDASVYRRDGRYFLTLDQSVVLFYLWAPSQRGFSSKQKTRAADELKAPSVSF